MPDNNSRFLNVVEDRLLDLLTTQQHISPHRPVRQVLISIAERAGFESSISDAALRQTGIDAGTIIGRLRRSEITLLARTLTQLTCPGALENFSSLTETLNAAAI
jgi:hypothetical protein